MSSDSPLPATLEQILSGVRAQLDAELRTLADQMTRTAAADRDRALEEAARAAAEERTRAIDQVAAELRRQANDELQEARRAADAQFQEMQRAREAAEASVQELRRERDAAEATLRDVRQSTDARVSELVSERDRLRAELALVQRQLQDLEKRELARREQDERMLAARVRTHLAPAVRTLDEAATLGDVLQRLLESSLTYCDRAVLLLLNNDRLRPWRALGFEEGETDVRELPADAAGIAGTAAREARVLTHVGDSANVPSFAASSDISEASAFPVTVAGAVVAVLYGDVSGERMPDSTWVADLEVLVRHASRVLEAITMQQATGQRPVGVARRSQAPSSASGTTAPGASTSGGVS